MTRRPFDDIEDRITLGHTMRPPATGDRRRHLWTLGGGVVGSLLLLWVMVQLGQASTGSRPASTASGTAVPSSAQVSVMEVPGDREAPARPSATAQDPPAVQGPAIDTPREVLAMLDLRKQDLDRREQTVRQAEERLAGMKQELLEMLAKSEALQKQVEEGRTLLSKEREESKVKIQKQMTDQKAQHDRFMAEQKALVTKQSQEQKNQSQSHLAKILESMPAEEAAARLEQMPERKATEMLRLVKGKTASAILAQMKAARAAKLTEQLLETPR